MLDYDLECRNGIFFLRVKGSLTKETSQKLNSYLIPMIIKNGVKYLVYNLFDLNSIDSLGYEALKECKTAIKFNNGKIYYCNRWCGLLKCNVLPLGKRKNVPVF